jgi:hypothetical protein
MDRNLSEAEIIRLVVLGERVFSANSVIISLLCSEPFNANGIFILFPLTLIVINVVKVDFERREFNRPKG